MNLARGTALSLVLLGLIASSAGAGHPLPDIRWNPDGSLVLHAPDGGRLEYSLETITCGSRTISRGEAVEPLRNGERLSFRRGPIVEQYLPVGRGCVEQIFRIRRSLGSGDLAIRGRLSCGLPVRETPDGLRFGTSLQYGNAVAFDSSGARLDVPARWADGAVELRVPAAWLQRAAYPVTIDPLLGALIDVSGAVTINDAEARRQNDIDYNPATDEWFSVFNEIPAAADDDVHAVIITAATGAAGAAIDLDVSTDDTAQVGVAWNPVDATYLVVWKSDEAGAGSPTGDEVHGMVLNAAGTPVGGPVSFSISGGLNANSDTTPNVAVDTTGNWLVAWAADDGTGSFDIMGRIVLSGTTNVAPSFLAPPFAISATPAEDETLPNIAFGPSNVYLVVWRNFDANPGLGGVFGATVDLVGTAGAINEYDDTTQVVGSPDVTANLTNGEFLVAWDGDSGGSGLFDPYVVRVDSTGAPLTAMTSVDPDPAADAAHVAVTWNDSTNQYFILWFDDPDGDFTDYEVQCGRLNGPDIAILEANTVLGNPAYDGAAFTARLDCASSRAGTTHVIGQWIHVDTGGAGPPFPVEAQRFDIPPPLAITTASPLPGGTVGTAYATAIVTTGGTAPITFAVTAGALPPGLALDPLTGAITGTPTTAGTFVFDITATDALGNTDTVTYSLTIAAAGGGGGGGSGVNTRGGSHGGSSNMCVSCAGPADGSPAALALLTLAGLVPLLRRGRRSSR